MKRRSFSTIQADCAARAMARLDGLDMEEAGAMRILVVDDDVVILEILEIFLGTIGYDAVKLVTSAAQALDAIGTAPEPYECILLDINMPEMTGIELLSQIREMKTYEFVPVIMLTALGDRAHITDAFSAGAWDYIVKPFEMFELQARIENAALRNVELKKLIHQPNDKRSTLAFPTQLRAVSSNSKAADRKKGQDAGCILSGDAFDNYFASILTQTRSSLGVLTLLVANFDALANSLSSEDFDNYLIELARQLAREFSELQAIMSYQGEGVFMALSFAFDALGDAPLQVASDRAVAATDAVMLDALGYSTNMMVGRVLSQDLPENVEPAFILQVARSHLLSGSSASS